MLHYVNGYSYADIAGFLEVSKDAVRGRLHRGREMLKAEVLKMTRDTFDENRLDEKFVIEAANAAVREAHDAYNELGDKELSRKKVDEARALVEQLEPDGAEDPVALGDALVGLAMREQILGERDRAWEHLDRAKSLFERAGYRDGVEECRAVVAYDRLGAGDLAAAHKLFSEIEDYWRQRRSEGSGTARCGYLATARALESLGLDTDWSLVAAFHAGDCGFQREDGQIIHSGGFHLGFHKGCYPARVRNVPGPPPGPTPLPLVLIRNEPEVGDTLRFVNGDGRSEESVLETLTETVTTPAGTFGNCARSSSRIFATKDWTGDVVATRKLWLAPGVGIVRIAYQTVGQPEDTSELTEFHIEEPSTDRVPLAVGNWWKWRWIEGEEEFGFRTEFYKGIVAEQETTYVAVQYFFCVRKH